MRKLIIILFLTGCWMRPHSYHEDGSLAHKMVAVDSNDKKVVYKCIIKGCTYTERESRKSKIK